MKRSYENVQKTEVDYSTHIAEDTRNALRELQRKPNIPDLKTPFRLRLLSRGKVFHFPTIAIPKQLRRKHIVLNTNVSFGNHGGLVLKKELGRGTFGRVILIDTQNSGTIAIKIQSSVDSLAREFLVLQRLEQRMLQIGKQPDKYAFPRPINFISLADGGILSMSAASETGLNLVDLSNFYTLKLGKSVPELLAFHYTSVALRIIEELHFCGKILVRSTNCAYKSKIHETNLIFSLFIS